MLCPLLLTILSVVGCSANNHAANAVRVSTTPGQAPAIAHTTLRVGPLTALPAGTRRLTITDPSTFTPFKGPLALALGSDAVWLAGGLDRIDPKSMTLGKPLLNPDTQESGDVAAGSSGVWASDYDAGVVRRIDPHSGHIVATVKLPTGAQDPPTPVGIAFTSTGVWVASHHEGVVFRIDPRTNTVVDQVKVTDAGPGGPQQVASGFGSVWVGIPNSASVTRIDPQTNRVQAAISMKNLVEPCGGFATTRTAVWVNECGDGTQVARIDPRANVVTAVVDTGGKALQMAAAGDSLWFVTGGDPDANAEPGYLVEMLDNGTIARRYDLGNGFISGGIVIGFGSIWLTTGSENVVLRIPYPRS